MLQVAAGPQPFRRRHMAQSDGQAPRFFAFAERDDHDLDAVAQDVLARRLDRSEENDAVRHQISAQTATGAPSTAATNSSRPSSTPASTVST